MRHANGRAEREQKRVSRGARPVILRPGSIIKVVTFVTIAAAAVGIAPSVAEAQARGTMQVSAQVVATDNAFQALNAARSAVSSVSTPAAARRPEAAPTLARVTVSRDPRKLIVTIDYSRS
jgi:hypothetical protein